MAKTLSIDTRIELCGLFKGKIEKNICNDLAFYTDYITFSKKTLAPYKFLDYGLPLFCYGLWNKEMLAIVNNEQDNLFKNQDELFDTWIALCEQFKLLLERKEDGLRFYTTNRNGTEESQLKDSQPHSEKLNKVLIEVALDYLERDLLAFENNLPHNQFEFCQPINIEQINKRLEYGYIQKQKGKGTLKETEILISHICIQQLANLIKLDTVLKGMQISNIESITLSSNDFLFIYSFLEYFGLTAYKLDENNTTTESRLIRERYKNFPSQKNRELSEMLAHQKSNINSALSILEKEINQTTKNMEE